MDQYLIASPLGKFFTLPDQFKAVFDGSVYIGKADMDPLNPAQQIDVFVENEDGSTIQVAQPIKTNSGGYAVYNGNPSKFICNERYSMVVLNKNGAEVWRFYDVSTLDPSAISHNNTKERDAVGAHDSIYYRRTTVAEIESGVFAVGSLLTVSDRSNAKFKVVSGGSPNGYDIIDAGSGNTAVLQIDGKVKASAFGLDEGAITAAIAKANDLLIPVDPDGMEYTITSNLDLPKFGFSGSGKITGATCTWSFTKTITTGTGILEFDDLIFDSVWDSSFNGKLKINGDITYKSSNTFWGCYWNNFGDIEASGTLIIDVDPGQSINQNNWGNCRAAGGLHIKGVLAPEAGFPREAHNNLFLSLDTTGANLTASDGSTGHHILNDSFRNQQNTINNWYAESSGNRTARGNWNILGSNVDANNLPYEIDRNCNAFFSGGTQRNGSFISASANRARGGDWSELDNLGFPLGLTGSATQQVSATNAPDGNPLAIKQDGSDSFRAVDILYPLGSDGVVSMTMFVYQEGSLANNVELLTGSGSFVQSGVSSYTKIGGGWYILRVAGVGQVRDEANSFITGRIRIYQTLGSAATAADFRYFGSYYLTVEDTCLLPCYKDGPKTAYGTAAPTVGKWNIGDRCVNSAPTVGQPKSWICTLAGTPGTWVSEGNLYI